MGVCKGECIFGIKKFKREVLTRESRNTNVFFFFCRNYGFYDSIPTSKFYTNLYSIKKSEISENPFEQCLVCEMIERSLKNLYNQDALRHSFYTIKIGIAMNIIGVNIATVATQHLT